MKPGYIVQVHSDLSQTRTSRVLDCNLYLAPYLVMPNQPTLFQSLSAEDKITFEEYFTVVFIYKSNGSVVYEVKCTLKLFYITFHYSDKFILKVKPYTLTTLFAYDLVCPMANAFFKKPLCVL